MYRYNSNGKLITSAIPIKGLAPITMTDTEAKHCIGFDASGNPIYSQAAINAEIQTVKQKQVSAINAEFDKQCSSVGVNFEGNSFQYDDLSQNRLLKFKDISEVNFWRSVDNINVIMTNQQKNNLYSLLLFTWATKFKEKSQAIDSIGA